MTGQLQNLWKKANSAGQILFIATLVSVCIGTQGIAAPLEYNPFTSLTVEGQVGYLVGRIGFDRDTGRPGTQNDFRADLGMDKDFLTWRIFSSARPLEHHVVRVYGSIPQHHTGGRTLERTLQTRINTYPAGTHIDSDLSTLSFGFGYDLDLLVGPRWYGGFNAELQYLNATMNITSGPATGKEDTISVSEIVPCFGIHLENRQILPFTQFGDGCRLGGFARITHSMTPNFANYLDINAGLSLEFQLNQRFGILAKAGVQRESFYHDLEKVNGNVLEFTRDGIFFSFAGSF